MVSNDNKIKKYIGYIMLLASAAAMIMMVCQTGTDDIWYDEVFSVCFAKMRLTELLAMTARDVHPPLYYIYLKFFTWLACAVFGEGIFVTAAKCASVLPWVVIIVFALTYIRKNRGDFVAGLFAFFVTTMPQLGNYYVEIRMYSFALLLIMLSGLAAFEIAKAETCKINIHWFVFFVAGILTAYTQYYACIGIIGEYIGLILVLLIEKRTDYIKRIIRIIACGVLSAILYLPWLPVLFKQYNNISGSYWIQPLTLRSIAGCMKFIMLPVADKVKLSYLLAGIAILILAVTVLLYIKKEFKKAIADLLICVMPLMIVVLSGFILSALGTPIFVYRYMIPVLGLFWLFCAICIDKLSDCFYVALAIIIPFAMLGILSCRGFYLEEHKKTEHMPLVKEAFEAIPDDAVIITNFDHVAAVSGYYFGGHEIYLYDNEIDHVLSDIMDGCGSYIDDDGIIKLLCASRRVYFFGSFNVRDEILEDWEKLSISSTEENSVLLERYWFNIYRLGME